MCKGLIAKKVGMSRIFQDNGNAVAVTYVQVEPNTVVRVKTEDKDGYNAVVLGVGPKKWKTRKGKEHTRYSDQKEWKVESLDGLAPGTTIAGEKFPKDSTIDITGTSKGRGFQGVIKRHKFSEGPRTHGSHHHRRTGSIGMCEFPGRVLKGKKMPGRMGSDTVTLKGRMIIDADMEKGLIAIKGPIPGSNGSHVYITLESWPEGYEEEKEVNEVAEVDKGAEVTSAPSETSDTSPEESKESEETKESKENKIASASAKATADKNEANEASEANQAKPS